MGNSKVILVTGSSKGIGRHLVEYYMEAGFQVIGCSRTDVNLHEENYNHYQLDVSDEKAVKQMFISIKKKFGGLDILINNAGVASMNHVLTTPLTTVRKILDTNVVGTFLMCREAAKLMRKRPYGRIVNFSSVATPLKLGGEAIYAASKAAIVSLTQILAKELADLRITINVIGPTPIATDLISSIPKQKISALLEKQAIQRLGEFSDVTNVLDFFIAPESNFITGQSIYLGGV